MKAKEMPKQTQFEASQSSVVAETTAPITSSSAASSTATSCAEVPQSVTWSNKKLKRDNFQDQ